MFQLDWHDWIGSAGAAIVVISYLLLQMQKIDSTRPAYSIFNAIGAALILFSLLYKFNVAAFIIELFWLLISLYGLFLCLGRERKQ